MIDLLPNDPNYTIYRYNGKTRALWGWTTKSAHACLKGQTWEKIAHVPDGKCETPTHLQRICRYATEHATGHKTVTLWWDHVLDVILKDNIPANAGGVVNVYVVSADPDLKWDHKIDPNDESAVYGFTAELATQDAVPVDPAKK